MLFVFYDVEVKKCAENDQKYTKTKKNETFIKVIDFFSITLRIFANEQFYYIHEADYIFSNVVSYRWRTCTNGKTLHYERQTVEQRD
jgi:hypothetical protein